MDIKTWWRSGLCFVLAVILLAFPVRAEAIADDYRLGYGDALTVTVVGQPSLSVSGQPIRPDGRISLPLVQHVEVRGKTVPEVTVALLKAYRPYLTNPQVVVQVDRFRVLRVTVLGQVGQPGVFEFAEPPSLIDVIATAGGLTGRAARGHIKVVEPGKAAVVYDLERFLGGQEVPPQLKEAAIVEVGEVWYPDYARILPLTASLLTATAIFLQLTSTYQLAF